MVPPVYNTRFPWNIIVKGSGMNGRIVSAVAILFCLISQSSNVFGNGETNSKSSGISFELNDSPWRLTSANLFQDQPALIPKFNFSPKIQTPAQANEFVADFFSTYKVGKSVLTSVPALQNSSNVDVILRQKSGARPTPVLCLEQLLQLLELESSGVHLSTRIHAFEEVALDDWRLPVPTGFPHEST